MNKEETAVGYDDMMRELEALVTRLEESSSTADLAAVMDDVERATALVKRCQGCLTDYEKRLEQLREPAE